MNVSVRRRPSNLTPPSLFQREEADWLGHGHLLADGRRVACRSAGECSAHHTQLCKSSDHHYIARPKQNHNAPLCGGKLEIPYSSPNPVLETQVQFTLPPNLYHSHHQQTRPLPVADHIRPSATTLTHPEHNRYKRVSPPPLLGPESVFVFPR